MAALAGSPGPQMRCSPPGAAPRPALWAPGRRRAPRAAAAAAAAQGATSADGGPAPSTSSSQAADAAPPRRRLEPGAGRRVAVLSARRAAAVPVAEAGRPLAEYMALPASQYSVLDANRVERIGDDTFRCTVGGLALFNLRVEPVITVSVTVGPTGPTVRLLSAELRGSKAAEWASERFEASMENVVCWRPRQPEAGGEGARDGRAAAAAASAGPPPEPALEIAADASIRVALEVPRWFVLAPVAAVEAAGAAVLQRVLDAAVPRFLAQLARDYAAWADGGGRADDGCLMDGGSVDECGVSAPEAAEGGAWEGGWATEAVE